MPVKRPYEVITFSTRNSSLNSAAPKPVSRRVKDGQEQAAKKKKNWHEINAKRWALHYAKLPLILPKSVSPLSKFPTFYAFPGKFGYRIKNDRRHPPIHVLNPAELQSSSEAFLSILDATTKISEYFGVAIFRFPSEMIPSIAALLQQPDHHDSSDGSEAPHAIDPKLYDLSGSTGTVDDRFRAQAYESQIQKGATLGIYSLSKAVVDAPVGEWLARIETGDVEQITSAEFWQKYKRKGVKPGSRRRIEVVVYAADLESMFPQTGTDFGCRLPVLRKARFKLFPNQHLSPITMLEQPWNILRRLPKDEWVPGIQTSYTYVGAPHTAFGYHLEDYHAYSGNISLAGAPKVWLIVPASYRYNFEQFVRKLLKLTKKQREDKIQSCEQVLRHMGVIIDEVLLPLTTEEQKKLGFRVFKVVQRPGDMIITMPGAYHGGYNLGYNLNQAVNFGTPRWLDAVMDYQPCTCFENQQDPLIIDTKKLKETLAS